MTSIDRLIRSWRESKVQPYLYSGIRLLDIGCGDGSIFERAQGRLVSGVGVDPDLERDIETPRYRLLAGLFPNRLEKEGPFDVISLLAVLEHVPNSHQRQLAADIAKWLKPRGHVIVTVPSPRADAVLDRLRSIGIIDGMSLEQHYGYSVERTPDLFGAAGLTLRRWSRFQLGFNNLFVFQKP